MDDLLRLSMGMILSETHQACKFTACIPYQIKFTNKYSRTLLIGTNKVWIDEAGLQKMPD
jgi:hypothetical protein